MSRIPDIFARLRTQQRGALMPFVTGGFPTLEATKDVLPALEHAGASAVEIGIPFSDPIADGPVIAASMHDALECGVTPPRIFEVVRSVRDRVDLGLLAMVSASIVHRMGVDRFIADAAASGFDGLIVPDADTEGGMKSPAGAIAQSAQREGLCCSFLIAPTTPEKRIAEIAAISSGFLYVLARTGITGERDAAPDIAGRVATVRQHSDLPIAVGFGISTAAHVEAVTRHADAAIVGSALVRRMRESQAPVQAAEDFVRELAAGLSRPLAAG